MREFYDYFDKIYVLNLLENKERRDFIINQFKAWGVYEKLYANNKLEIVEAIKLPWIDKKVVEMMGQLGHGDVKSLDGYNVGAYNCACEHYKILKRSLMKGYNRIMVLEDDVCLLKDYNAFVNILETMPNQFDILHLEGFLFPPDDRRGYFRDLMANTLEDGVWKDSSLMKMWDAGGLIYSKHGMEVVTNGQATELKLADHYTFWHTDNCYFYSYPLMIQEYKNVLKSDIISLYADDFENDNVLLDKIDMSLYYHMEDFK